jgi:hypothetical protein
MLLETALMFLENNKSTSELAENYVSPFFVNDGHFEQVLDDEVLYRLITAMDLGKPVAFAYDDTEYKNIYPIKAVTNVESGLRYLFGYLSDEEKYVFFSLDKITGLEIALKSLSFDYEKYEREYENRTKYSFSGVTCLNDGEEPVELSLQVRTSEFLKNMKKLFLPDTIKTDKPENKNYYTAKVLVNTLEELKPWLRRNMNNVRLVGTEVMNDEVREMRELYGII